MNTQPDIETLVEEAVTAPPALRRERWGTVAQAMSSLDDDAVIDEAEDRAPTLTPPLERVRANWASVRDQATRAAAGEVEPDPSLLDTLRRYRRELSKLIAASFYSEVGGEG